MTSGSTSHPAVAISPATVLTGSSPGDRNLARKAITRRAVLGGFPSDVPETPGFEELPHSFFIEWLQVGHISLLVERRFTPGFFQPLLSLAVLDPTFFHRTLCLGRVIAVGPEYRPPTDQG